MRPAELTPIEIADLLDAAYRHDQGLADDGPDPETRRALADDLGCHEDARVTALEAWRQVMRDEPGEGEEDAAEYWLDVEFVEPCDGEREVEQG